MKNITFSAPDTQIAQARELAQLRGTTLNEEFRVWLQHYVTQQGQDEKYAKIRGVLDRITATNTAPSVPKELRYSAEPGAPKREAFNDREARILKRLDNDASTGE